MRRAVAVIVLAGALLMGGAASALADGTVPAPPSTAADGTYRCIAMGGGMLACVDSAGNDWVVPAG